MSARDGWVRTGRIDTRKVCTGCGARIKFGDPKPTSTWPDRLRLSQEQINLLLVAFAEFEEVGGGSPVEAVDWISSTVLGRSNVHVDADGAPARNESGGFARHKAYTHRHPFPLPRIELPRKLRAG